MENNGEGRIRIENKIEKITLNIYTIYTLAMAATAFWLNWAYWIVTVILFGLIVSWGMFIRKVNSHQYRCIATSCIAAMNFILYGCVAGDFFSILSTMAALVILLAIYRITQIMYITFGASAIIFFYHLFIAQTIHIPETSEALSRMILQIGSIITVEVVTYYLVKTQIDSSLRLEETIKELQMAENSKSDFMANVSHEIRTPVNAVCGLSEILLQEELLPKQKEDVHDIQMAGRNLQRIISDLLDFTELQSGEVDIIEEPYNMTSTVNDVMNMTIAQIGNKNIDLIVDCDSQIPRSLVGDEQKIRRAMVNILNNAVKFTTEGCIILKIDYRVESYGVNLIINIRDTGKGIKKENLEKIFTNFNQVDTKKNRQEGGIGLGMAITKSLVLKMGGFIKVDSEWEKGTEVQFVIPQKVLDNQPIIEVKDAREKQIIAYVDIEKYKYALARESYSEMMYHIAKQLQVPFIQCRNLDEMKRRMEKSNFTHIFLGWEEYEEDSQFFEEVAEKTPVFVIVDKIVLHQNMDKLEQSKVYRMVKPFYALSIATALNGEAMLLRTNENANRVRFVAPDASVLVIDDSLMNLKVVEGLLRPYRMNVFTAESGAEALKKIERCDYDFVLLDHMMPEMDGVETLHKIRNKPGNYFKTVPIIAFTANAVGGAREMFLQEGFQDFVSKPIEIPVLERILRKYIPDHKKIKVDNNAIQEVKKQEEIVNEVSPKKKNDLEIDLELGIQYAGGNMEDYAEIVDIYCKTGREKVEEIQKYYDQKDWKNYTILVHSVKSMSLGIGAVQLSEMAKALEEAGKNSDVKFITQHQDEMSQLYKKIIEIAEENILHRSATEHLEHRDNEVTKSGEQNTDQKSTLTKEQYAKFLQRMDDSLESFEEESVLPILEELSGYQYLSENITEIVQRIETMVKSFDFMGAKEEINRLKEEMR